MRATEARGSFNAFLPPRLVRRAAVLAVLEEVSMSWRRRTL
jgi:hypothetical protein